MTGFLDYALSFMRCPYITVYFLSFLTSSNSGTSVDGETCCNFTTMRGCMIATNYIDFNFSSSFRHRGLMSLNGAVGSIDTEKNIIVVVEGANAIQFLNLSYSVSFLL